MQLFAAVNPSDSTGGSSDAEGQRMLYRGGG
jgi:hypothetical protein